MSGAGEYDILLSPGHGDLIASRCATWIADRVSASASAHTVDTDFGTLKVRSNAATGRAIRLSRSPSSRPIAATAAARLGAGMPSGRSATRAATRAFSGFG